MAELHGRMSWVEYIKILGSSAEFMGESSWEMIVSA
jgi:hypothetical protein